MPSDVRWSTDDSTENDARDWWVVGLVALALLLAVAAILVR